MAEVINIPRLSDTMTEGKVVKWNYKVGDTVQEGDIIAEIETDKAIQDFESEYDGVLLYQGVAEGEAGPVDSILAIIGEPGEDISAYVNAEVVNENGATTEEGKAEQETMNEVETEQIVPQAIEIPSNVNVVTMPRLSDTMEEGKVMKWNYNVGDKVEEGDIIAEIETDKAVQDFETEYSGTLLYQGVPEGESAKVDSILAIIGEAGTDVSGVVQNFSLQADDGMPQNDATPQTEVKKEAPKTVAPPQLSTPKKESPKASPKKVVARVNNERIFASPLAKKLAEEKGINLAQVVGTGDNGRVTKFDIENFTPSAAGIGFGLPVQQRVDSETPNSQVRNIIAKRLSESKFTAPHYYLTISLDMDPAMEARASINSIPDTKISFNDMVMKAAALSLKEHPQVNSSWYDDKIVHHGAINIGMAVAIEDGLLVPVLKNTDQMSFPQISETSKDLAKRARIRKLNADEMEGSTFSISNLGMLGIESFTSIINQPNSAIMSVGAIEEKPVVKNGQIVVGHEMKVTLACDHRVIDGATGAEFLQTFKDFMQNPIKMLVM